MPRPARVSLLILVLTATSAREEMDHLLPLVASGGTGHYFRARHLCSCEETEYQNHKVEACTWPSAFCPFDLKGSAWSVGWS